MLTLASITMAGARFAAGYFGLPEAHDLLASVTSPHALALGFITYALPLVLILAAHEAGHAVVMLRSGMRPTFPFFLPLPPPLGFTGTLGAVIGAHEPFADRRSMVRIAAAGPLVGFVASIVCVTVGLALSLSHATTGQLSGGVRIETPFLYDRLADLLHVSPEASVHPVALAGSWGLLLTSLQLLPAGQLDGGHMARAFLGTRTRWLSLATVAFLVLLGIRSFPGYLVLAGAVLLGGLAAPPPQRLGDDIGVVEAVLAVACAAAFIVSFVLVPLVL